MSKMNIKMGFPASQKKKEKCKWGEKDRHTREVPKETPFLS